MNCNVSIYLAHAMAVYTIASIYYLFQTQNIGTPFNDSLSHEQKQIKAIAAAHRKTIFMQGSFVAIAYLLIFKPFAKC